ncbi:MAG TPA: hypothetical protein VFF94_15595, partial [Novosphingobium sp.]|nr:hypothetical protein [Novosphingobium sp.]
MSAREREAAFRQWGWPIALALSTVLGLLCALPGAGGWWRALSWAALGAPLAAMAISLRPGK